MFHLEPLTLAAAVGGLIVQPILSSIHEVPTVKFLSVCSISKFLLLAFLFKFSSTNIILQFVQFNATFYGTLIVATIIRRLYFHPLRHFPGSKLAALSKLYDARLSFLGNSSTVIRLQHRQYGDFIRTGPNELSISNVQAMSLYSRQTFNNRGPFYESGYAASRSYNVLNVRDNEQHRLWRRIWDQAFKASALSEYAPRVELHVEKFISVLEKINGEEVNCLKPIQNLAYDIMADLGFGRDIGTQDGEDGSLMEFLRSYLRAVTTIGSLRNLCDMMSILPSGLKSAKSIHFQKKSIEMLEHRKRMGKSRADVFTHLLAEDTETGTTFSDAELASNSRLLIVAGSDTTSTTIACIFRELALNPSIQQKLYEEVHTAAQGFPVLDSKNTKDLPYLNGVVKETLRLWNPVPSGAETLTGPEGATVVGRYIPPNTTIRVHHYALMTDDRYFPQGDKFIPERWTDQKMEGVKDIRAWVPFSYGPHACVGKHLALTEIRLTVARTVERFSIELGETYDDELFRKEWKSYVTVVLGDVPVRFKPR